MPLHDFSDLLQAARQQPELRRLLFVFAAMSGRGGFAPNPDEAVQPLWMMVEAIKGGHIGEFLAVSRAGELVQLQ